jgi:hypothetical protein
MNQHRAGTTTVSGLRDALGQAIIEYLFALQPYLMAAALATLGIRLIASGSYPRTDMLTDPPRTKLRPHIDFWAVPLLRVGLLLIITPYLALGLMHLLAEQPGTGPALTVSQFR